MAKNDFKFISYKDKVKKELDATAERGMTKVLMIIKAAAKSGAPVETGQLRDRIDGEWHFTRGQKPQKFLRNAFRQNKEKAIEILGKEYGATFKGG